MIGGRAMADVQGITLTGLETTLEEKEMIETKDVIAYPLNTTEAVSSLPATPKDNLIIEMARRLLALHDWLGGPPMTERERIQREIAAAQRECRIFYDFLNLPDR
jgi:hypothetical protein